MSIVYTSPSYTANKPKWRILCPFSAELPPERRAAMLDRLAGLLHGIGAELAGESWTLSQSYYYGSVKHNPAHRVQVIAGTPIDLHDDLDDTRIDKPGDASATEKTERCARIAATDPADISDARGSTGCCDRYLPGSARRRRERSTRRCCGPRARSAATPTCSG